jgi:hypothetical protein
MGAAAIFLRCPRLFFEPRFWAEEGYFFSYAFSHSAFDALTRPDGGNFDLPRNLASILAVHLAPPEWAPLVTTLFSFGIQLIPLALILNHSSPALKSTFGQAAAIALYLLAAMSDEIWLTSLHSQRYFSIAAFLILLDAHRPDRPVKTWLQRVLLLAAGLAGPETVLLAPMFLVKTFLEPQRENKVQAGLVSACAALQFWVFVLFPSEVSRFSPLDLRTFATIIWTKNFMLPLFGGPGIRPFQSAYSHFQGMSGQLLGISLLLAEIGMFYALSRRIPSRDRILILGSFIVTSVFSIAFAIGEKAPLIGEYSSNRYFYAPNFMLALLLVFNLSLEAVPRRLSAVWTCLLIVVLWQGADRFRRFGGSSIYREASWRQEVRLWRANPQYRLRIWPDGWVISLNTDAPANGK